MKIQGFLGRTSRFVLCFGLSAFFNGTSNPFRTAHDNLNMVESTLRLEIELVRDAALRKRNIHIDRRSHADRDGQFTNPYEVRK